MKHTIKQVLDCIEENSIKFIRLVFCDLFGKQMSLSIMPSELPSAFKEGISFEASSLKGFMNIEESDLLLFPDPATLSILPYRPQQGRSISLFCEIKYPDGRRFEADSRSILKQAVKTFKAEGYNLKIGVECEFYLFQYDEAGNLTNIPHDEAGYCDMTPFDKGENVRREICFALEEVGIKPESAYHEQGPGQNEINFKYSDPLTAADNLITFRSIVKSIAIKHGLYASFMPKPIQNKIGSGLHINFLLENQYTNSFIAGIIERLHEMTMFLNPLPNSYERLGYDETPRYVTWSTKNRSQLIRVLKTKEGKTRVELRSPDPACNPYIALTFLIYAGLEGIKEQKILCEPTEFDLYEATSEQVEDIPILPNNLGEAIRVADGSSFVRSVLTPNTIETYLKAKEEEYKAYFINKDYQESKKYLPFQDI